MGKLACFRTALAAWLACVSLAACTKIAGLDSLQEGSCFPLNSCTDATTVDGHRDATTVTATPEAGSLLGDDGGAPDGAIASSCQPGTVLCGTSCVSPTDVHYCGSCTFDCTTLPNVELGGPDGGVACVSGRCTYECMAGYADCDGVGAGCAVNLGSSSNCGACGTRCASNAPLCIPTGPDGGATYACGVSCPAGAPTICAGSCVNEQTSSTSCGGCGAAYACAMGTTCVGGHCVGPDLSLSTTTYAFPATTLGQTATAAPFVVKNSGNGASATLTTALAGANASEFAITSDPCAGHVLAAGASCTLDVSFTPTSRGPRAASLNVNGGTVFAALTGSGQDTVGLTVTKSGTGAGTVTGGPIACGSTCSGSVARTTTTNPVVTLSATPDGTSTFAGWSGACSGSGPNCNVTMSQAQTVNAEFDKDTVGLTVTANAFGSSTGTIASTPAGINCTAPCTQKANFPVGTAVTLTATGSPNVWWGTSPCTGTTCAVTVSSPSTVTATFSNNNYVFATSNVYSGNLGGQAGGDALCAQAAKNARLPGRYVAWLTTSSTTAVSRLGSARGWIRTDGLPFADTIGATGGKTGLRNGQIDYAPMLNEFGLTNTTNSNLAASWTGAEQDGSLVSSPAPDDCNDWTDGTSNFDGAAGLQSYGSVEWTYEFVGACTNSYSVYCFGTDLSNPIVVPAANGRIAFLSNGNFNPASGLAAADSLCQEEASTDGFANASTFLAFLPTPSASALSRFNLSGSAWQRPDGIPLASSPSGLVNTLLATPSERGSTDPCSDALPVYCFQQ